VGTQAVLSTGDAGLVKGFLINKFRGDPALFDEGYRLISAHTGWRGFGVVPWFAEAHRLPAEDALDVRGGAHQGALSIAVPVLSRIANFDDLDPLAQEPGVTLTMVRGGAAIPGDSDLVILPGTKSTRADLAYLRAQGWDIDIAAHVRRGGHVLGICGGYQMLGHTVSDPHGIEGMAGDTPGLGLLDVATVMHADKHLTQVAAVHSASGLPVAGYEIHIGETHGPDCARPFATVDGRAEGAISADGRITGSYLHGLFASDAFRASFLAMLGAAPSGLAYGAGVEQALDALADHLEAHVDVAGLLGLAT